MFGILESLIFELVTPNFTETDLVNFTCKLAVVISNQVMTMPERTELCVPIGCRVGICIINMITYLFNMVVAFSQIQNVH